MSRTTLLTLAASLMLGAAVVAPTAAIAQFLPPPGPPPALAGPPPGFGGAGPLPGPTAGGPPVGGPAGGPAAGLQPRGLAAAPPRDVGGGPARLSRLDGAGGLRGLERGNQANFRGVEGRAAAYGASGYARNSYGSYSNYRYGHGYRHWPYAAAAYAYGSSYASSDDGCYYVRRYGNRRVLVCDRD